MVYVFICLAKKRQFQNLRCYKTMQLEIGGSTTKTHVVHCLQPVAYYFKGKSIYF